ncbi:MAG: serine/threonine-protein kinase [Methanomicrobium sp.]|nr:serine/threonine-protein kinase [Methanomicrobium sp.]
MKNNILTGIIIALFVAVVILSADAAMPGEGFSFLPKESETAYTTVTVVSSEKIPGISMNRNDSVIKTGNESRMTVLKYSETPVMNLISLSNADFETFNGHSSIYGGAALETHSDNNLTGHYTLNGAWHDVWYTGESGAFFFTLIISLIIASILAITHNRKDEKKADFEPAERIMISAGYFFIGALLCFISAQMTGYSYQLFIISENGLFICIGLIFALIYSAASLFLLCCLTFVSGRTGYVVHALIISLAACGIFYYFCMISENPVLDGMNIVYIPVLILLSIFLTFIARFNRRLKDTQYSVSDRLDIPQGRDNTIIPDFRNESFIRRNTGFPDELFKNYTDISIAGSGGIAIVFRAKRLHDMKETAIKVPINRDEITGRSFIREIGVWEKLRHKNIVKVYSVNILPVPYIEMEYISRNLSDLFIPMPVKRAAEIMTGVLEGLLYAHNKGIVHHDIKPGNVLIEYEGTPKLTDWGLCRMASDEFEYTNIGFSFMYAAPEQIFPAKFGKPDTRTDIYQAGLLFYEILTGRRPVKNDIIGEFLKEGAHEITPVSELLCDDSLKEFDRIIMHCLEKDPSKRYPDINVLLSDIEKICKNLFS